MRAAVDRLVGDGVVRRDRDYEPDGCRPGIPPVRPPVPDDVQSPDQHTCRVQKQEWQHRQHIAHEFDVEPAGNQQIWHDVREDDEVKFPALSQRVDARYEQRGPRQHAEHRSEAVCPELPELVEVSGRVNVLAGERKVRYPPHHLTLSSDALSVCPPVKEHVRLRHVERANDPCSGVHKPAKNALRTRPDLFRRPG